MTATTEATGERVARKRPPVILLGGEANALSVARDLGRAGVKVYAICGAESVVRHSRYCRWIDVRVKGPIEDAWGQFLLSPKADHLRGAVLLTCSDTGIQVLMRYRQELSLRFKLDLCNPAAQADMLDKFTTYRHAKAAGVPTPRFWESATREQILELRESLAFPVLVKPRLSHLFEAHFGRKHVIVANFDELMETFDKSTAAKLDVLIMEWVPGPDSQLCSYYTYLDEDGKPLFDFTKRIIRRYPSGMGTACYHITDWVPEIIDHSNRLFKQAGLRGLANIEFKRDPRDGEYKVIECNARFTASNCLVSASGCGIALFVYNRIVGEPLPTMDSYARGMRLWDPYRDFAAFGELWELGQITLGAWLLSIMYRQTFAFFSWSDPMPAVVRSMKPVKKLFLSLGRSLRRVEINGPHVAVLEKSV
ncbi:MAG TPA: hypothetical protein VGN72_11415 [Tepidisphaeraceae bacterium]|jgi:predicted ATP-grasp superfamily ATP-dependent carboligase|nr:hypothetical protein [Tepidisphaeraceae bacterium]